MGAKLAPTGRPAGLRYSHLTLLTQAPIMKHTTEDLHAITATTLGHYNAVAESFREGTRDHDVSQNIDALLRHIQGEAPLHILDLGCGPGRDLRTFTAMGHVAVGLDGSEKVCPDGAPGQRL